MKNVYVVNCCRTAIGSFGGSLKDTPAADLGAVCMKETLRRAGIEGNRVCEVYLGGVLTAGFGQNIARQAAMKAGIPAGVTATAVNMVCGSGMKSVVEGVRAILAGDADIVMAGGTENMSRSPYLFPDGRWGARMNDSAVVDSMIRDGLWDAFNDCHMGITAENICDTWAVTREEMDAFALGSQLKARAAVESGRFTGEIVPVQIRVKKETAEFSVDEYPRAVTAESLSRLSPAFRKEGGRVTAGNSSGINDGAAAVLVASEAAVEQHGLKPMARITGWGQAGVDPSVMGIGPVEACRKALAMAGASMERMDLVEANEAFASQSIAVARELGLDMAKVNVNGGAIALGHPIGASGARIIVTLLHEMQKRPNARMGLATLCIGGGMGIATVFEKC